MMVLCMLAHVWACNSTGAELVLIYQVMYCICVVNEFNSVSYACICTCTYIAFRLNHLAVILLVIYMHALVLKLVRYHAQPSAEPTK